MNKLKDSQFDIVNQMTNIQYQLDYLRKIITQDLTEQGDIVNICINVKDKKPTLTTQVGFDGEVTKTPQYREISYLLPFNKSEMTNVVTALLRRKEDELCELDNKLKKIYLKPLKVSTK